MITEQTARCRSYSNCNCGKVCLLSSTGKH